MVSRTLTIAANNDDMYYFVGPLEPSCESGDVVRIGGWAGYAVHVSLRFLNFPGAGREIVLTSAKLYLHCALAKSPTQTVHMQCDKAVNPTLAGGTCDPRERTLTTASVDWLLPSPDVGAHFYSVDFKAALQEVIDQATFTAGNAVLVAILGHSGGGDSNGLEVASYEHPTGDPAQLVLEYTFRQQGGML